MIENKEILRLFPSLVFKGKFQDLSICDDALQLVEKFKNIKDGSGTDYKFTTPDNLQDYPEFESLTNILMKETAAVLDFYNVKRDSHYITSMWAHSTKATHRHIEHVHPNNYLSGLLYLQTPINCGNTIFIDPRAGSNMIRPDFTEPNYFNQTSFVHQPEKGTLLIWNSWLPHMVDYASQHHDEDRVALAFNVMFKGEVTRPSERMLF
jgi:uncharacterized protein (TIGR02466 family)